MTMTAKSCLKFLGVAFLTMVAVFYLTAVAVTGWNLLAPLEYRWMDIETVKVASFSLLVLPFITAAVFVFMAPN